MPSSDEATRSGALLIARPDLGTLVVRGSERIEWLQGVLTCDVAELAPGAGRWGLSLSKQGKILADVLVVAAKDATYLGIVREALPRTLDWLGGFLVMEDADIVDASVDHTWFTLHGPRAADVGASVIDVSEGASAPLDVTGLGDVALVVRAGSGDAVADAARRAGATLGTDADWLTLRVERLVPAYGVDMNDQRSPHDASLDRRCVSWSKGCYLGQEAVCMQDMRGKVKRRLVLLRLEGDEPPEMGTPVKDGAGVVVGETRSVAKSPTFGGFAAIALVGAASAAPETFLSVNGRPARVTEPAPPR